MLLLLGIFLYEVATLLFRWRRDPAIEVVADDWVQALVTKRTCILLPLIVFGRLLIHIALQHQIVLEIFASRTQSAVVLSVDLLLIIV